MRWRLSVVRCRARRTSILWNCSRAATTCRRKSSSSASACGARSALASRRICASRAMRPSHCRAVTRSGCSANWNARRLRRRRIRSASSASRTPCARNTSIRFPPNSSRPSASLSSCAPVTRLPSASRAARTRCSWRSSSRTSSATISSRLSSSSSAWTPATTR